MENFSGFLYHPKAGEPGGPDTVTIDPAQDGSAAADPPRGQDPPRSQEPPAREPTDDQPGEPDEEPLQIHVKEDGETEVVDQEIVDEGPDLEAPDEGDPHAQERDRTLGELMATAGVENVEQLHDYISEMSILRSLSPETANLGNADGNVLSQLQALLASNGQQGAPQDRGNGDEDRVVGPDIDIDAIAQTLQDENLSPGASKMIAQLVGSLGRMEGELRRDRGDRQKREHQERIASQDNQRKQQVRATVGAEKFDALEPLMNRMMRYRDSSGARPYAGADWQLLYLSALGVQSQARKQAPDREPTVAARSTRAKVAASRPKGPGAARPDRSSNMPDEVRRVHASQGLPAERIGKLSRFYRSDGEPARSITIT